MPAPTRHAAAAALVALLNACATQPGDAISGAVTPTAKPAKPSATAWRDDFSGTTLHGRWSVSNGLWPAFWIRNGLSGSFNASNVTLNGSGQLVMKLAVQRNADGTYTASAAELATTGTYGYGVYEARMRAASTSSDPAAPGASASGNVSAFFNYINDSETEINQEVEGHRPTKVTIGAWKTTASHFCAPDLTENCVPGATNPEQDLTQDFHTYRWVWRSGSVAFYLDGVLQWSVANTKRVPSTPARVMLNFWPTNSAAWGGLASAPADGTPQTLYMLVDYVSFTP